MTGINTNTGLITPNQTDSSTQQPESASTDGNTATKIEQTPDVSASVSDIKTDNVEISTRAEKIQKLNEEFFPAGPRAFTITSEFIDRLKEYGFLSANDADKFGGSTGSTNSNNQEAKTIGELSVFIDSFVGTVEKVDPDSTLIDILLQAQTVIDNVNKPTTESLKINIPNITEQLKLYSDTATDQLPETDQASLKQLVLALSIANILAPGANTSVEIDKYLEIKALET